MRGLEEKLRVEETLGEEAEGVCRP